MSDAKIKRLRELMTAVTQGREAVSREFTMRVPAEPDRDADLVLQWAADQIESLEIFRRDAKVENAELHSQIESLQRENEMLAEIKSMYESAMATDRQRIKELRAAAITPEMRERIAVELSRTGLELDGLQSQDYARACDILRDLLGEQG